MKRFNLYLPKSQSDYLLRESKKLGLTKAKYLRQLLLEKKQLDFFSANKFAFQNWNLSSKETFNFKIEDSIANWILDCTKKFSCSKTEVVRSIIEYEMNENGLQNIIGKVKNEAIKIDDKSVLIDNINAFLIKKNYFALNKFLLNTSYNDYINLGAPEFLIYAVSELEHNYKDMTKSILILKAEMQWFLGQTADAISTLERLFSLDEPIKKLKAKFLYGEILADLGESKKSKKVLDEVIFSLTENVPGSLKMKALNKLGLSMYYINSLDEVKDCYLKALEIAQSTEEKAIGTRYLASLYISFENFEFSENLFSDSKKFFNSIENKNLNEYSRFLITYADLQLAKANWKSAYEYSQKAISISTRINHISNLSWALRINADSLFNLGNIKQAFSSIDKSIVLAESMGSISNLTKSHRNKSKYLIAQKDYNSALSMLGKSRFFEKKLAAGSIYNYNMASKWQNYVNALCNKEINFKSLHNLSQSMNLKKQFKDETKNDYVLGYLYFISEDPDHKSKGIQILNRLYNHSMEVGYKQAQFAIEGIFRFGAFTTI